MDVPGADRPRVDQAVAGTGPRRTVDLNSDLGEGFGRWSLGDDEAILQLVTSANVACGFHAGDPSTLRRVCTRAAERGVGIGAQVSYRDLAGFGRRFIAMDPEELIDEVIYQIAALDGFARIAGSRVTYVKPHGALYNAAAGDPEIAEAIARAVRTYDPSLAVLGLAGSHLVREAHSAGLTAVPEAFADRAYTADGLLVSRREPGAVLHDPEIIAARCVQIATESTVEAVDGTTITVDARSICVHGDTDGAVGIAQAVRRALEGAGVELRPFTGGPG
ncbi:5-oxoprolinase subunit A [Terrabacter sp. BE26]